MAGGSGGDIFRYNAATDSGLGDLADTITDFNAGTFNSADMEIQMDAVVLADLDQNDFTVA